MWGRLLQVIRAHDPCIKGPLVIQGYCSAMANIMLPCMLKGSPDLSPRSADGMVDDESSLVIKNVSVCVCVCWCRRGQIQRRAYKLYVAGGFFELRDSTPREWLCWLAWPCNAHRAMLVIANEYEVNPIHRFWQVLQAYVSDYRYHNTIVVFQIWND